MRIQQFSIDPPGTDYERQLLVDKATIGIISRTLKGYMLKLRQYHEGDSLKYRKFKQFETDLILDLCVTEEQIAITRLKGELILQCNIYYFHDPITLDAMLHYILPAGLVNLFVSYMQDVRKDAAEQLLLNVLKVPNVVPLFPYSRLTKAQIEDIRQNIYRKLMMEM